MPFTMEIIILITNIFYIIFCKLAFNLNFKYRRKIDNCLLKQSILIMFSVIKSVIANTNIHVNSFIYFINTYLEKYNTTYVYYNMYI